MNTKATVISAVPLTDVLKKKVQSVVESRFDTTDVVFAVDPKVIGGLVVQIGAKRIDVSVENYLSQLTHSL